MKKGIGVLFVFLFLVSSVYAVCSDDQTLFKLYRENNSHVSTYSDGNFPIEVCYNEFYGINYLGLEPHDCYEDNGNVVFWINSSKNSHISSDETDEYTIPVCYGNLKCKFTSVDCSDTEVLIAKSYSLENSHISLRQEEYSYNICCTNTLEFRESFWSDLVGNQVDSVELGDSVLMIAKGFEFNTTQAHNYSINGAADLNFVEKAWNWITFRGWEPSESWVMNSLNEWKTSIVGIFSFNVNVIGTSISANSGFLNILEDERDTIPTVEILSEDSVVTLVNTPIIFNSTVKDEDDFLTVTWDFGDGTPQLSKQNYALATSDSIYLTANYTFSEPGHYVVKLTASERDRNEKTFDSVDVFVYDEGVNVIPVVSSPINGKNDYGNTIWFDATQSFVADCSLTQFRTGYDYKINDTELHCMYVHAPGETSVGSGYTLGVKWVIDGKSDDKWDGAWG
ncbi:PKD domain-containing protein, partial [archaeon]|nr:PKD domain-containing protein [archaeon]